MQRFPDPEFPSKQICPHPPWASLRQCQAIRGLTTIVSNMVTAAENDTHQYDRTRLLPCSHLQGNYIWRCDRLLLHSREVIYGIYRYIPVQVYTFQSWLAAHARKNLWDILCHVLGARIPLGLENCQPDVMMTCHRSICVQVQPRVKSRPTPGVETPFPLSLQWSSEGPSQKGSSCRWSGIGALGEAYKAFLGWPVILVHGVPGSQEVDSYDS
jgi:hypothetical protein